MKFSKFSLRRTPSSPVVFDDQGEAARRHALLVSQASTFIASLKGEVAVLGEVNQRLAAENNLLRAHFGLVSGSVQPSTAQPRDQTLQIWNSLASENATLLETVDAHEVERSVLRQTNQQITAENATLQDQRKRALADQWMLKQINEALEKEMSASKALSQSAHPSSVKWSRLNDERAEPLSGSAADRSAVGGAAGEIDHEKQAPRMQGHSAASRPR